MSDAAGTRRAPRKREPEHLILQLPKMGRLNGLKIGFNPSLNGVASMITSKRDYINTPIPAGFKIKKLPEGKARNWNTWARKGGMMGGACGSSRGVTSGNGIGIVPRAFIK
jgi:hypothetical protein